MNIISTPIPNLLIIEPQVLSDNRGFFYESYNKKKFDNCGLNYDFVQDNHSKSQYGILRGLHFQVPPFSQTKLVRVTSGKVLDVAVDLRKGSPTYLQHFSIELSAENHLQLLIPRGFAHGFVVLSDFADFMYKCDNYYSKEHENGIMFNDSMLNIDWKIPIEDLILSEKDKNYLSLGQSNLPFKYE